MLEWLDTSVAHPAPTGLWETLNEWIRANWPILLTGTLVASVVTNAVVLWRRSRWQKEASLAETLLNVTKAATSLALQASQTWQDAETLRQGLQADKELLDELFGE